MTSRIGSLANVKHRPGGGDKKIFDDKEYARQMNSEQSSISRSGPGSMVGSQAGSHPQVQSDTTQSSVPPLFCMALSSILFLRRGGGGEEW